MGDKGNAAGMEKAREFVSLLGNELRLSAQRCIFVPGNHDVHETEQSFDWFQNADKAKTVEPDEKRWHYEGSVIFIPNKDRYRLRFKQFSDIFYHKIMSQPYPDGYAEQGQAYLFPATGIQFLAFNSAWQIDQFNRKRAGIHPDAAARAIAEADRQVKDAVERGEMPKGQKPLRLAVWHHPVQHPESMRDIDFIGHLQGAGVKVALHGDVHEINRETMRNWHPKKIQIAGVGSFGSKAVGRPESTPRHYSLLEISRDLTSIRVHTRKQNTDHGAWSGWNEWPREDGQSGTLPYYDIKLA